MTLEIETNRGIAAQILRHRSFTFQEFSQRYADSSMLTDKIPLPNLRRQDTKNRQNSIDDVDPFVKQELEIAIERHFDSAMDLYQHMLSVGIAKECSRFVLPLAIPTKIYMSGSVRSWMHYIDLRSAHGTQKEHMDIAQQCRDVFVNELPICAEALEWT
jgi:thymidylate synthase (FAD)